MSGDDRFDLLLRDALAWHADRDARTAPSLEASSRAVAKRLGVGPRITSPLLTPGPTRYGVRWIVLVALLLAFATTIALVGSSLLFAPDPIRPGPLGFARGCDPGLRAGLLLEFEVDGASTVVSRNGLVVTDRSTSGTDRTSMVDGARYDVRRLSEHGLDLILARIAEVGVTPGCRTIDTVEATGWLRIRLSDGVAEVAWAPRDDDVGDSGTVAARAAAREAQVSALHEALRDLDGWLPADLWLEREPRRVTPDAWLVTIGALPTDYVPGDRLALPEGPFIDGSDPRYERIVLPDAVEPLEFGVEQTPAGRIGTGAVVRCGVVDQAAARALAASLDGMDLGADGYGDVFTEDLAWAVGIDIRPIDPAGFDCATETADLVALQQPPGARAAPDGDLAAIDPCELVTPELLERLGADGTTPARSRLALGAEAYACALTGPLESGTRVTVATLTLYPRTVDRADAETLAAEALDGPALRRQVGTGLAWAGGCLASPRPFCPRAAAAWADGTFVAIEFDLMRIDGPDPTFDDGIAALFAVLERAE